MRTFCVLCVRGGFQVVFVHGLGRAFVVEGRFMTRSRCFTADDRAVVVLVFRRFRADFRYRDYAADCASSVASKMEFKGLQDSLFRFVRSGLGRFHFLDA